MKRKKNHQALTFRLFLASLPHLFNSAPGGSALPLPPTSVLCPLSSVLCPLTTDNRQPTTATPIESIESIVEWRKIAL